MDGCGFFPADTVEGVWIDVSFQRRTLETAWRTAWVADLLPAEKLIERVLRVGTLLSCSLSRPLTLAWCWAREGGMVTVCRMTSLEERS